MVPSVESPFVSAVKRAFADALLVEIRRVRQPRDDVAAACGVSRSYLQFLLKGEQQASLGTLILLAEGLGMRPEDLFAKTMEHFARVRPTAADPEQTSEDPQS